MDITLKFKSNNVRHFFVFDCQTGTWEVREHAFDGKCVKSGKNIPKWMPEEMRKSFYDECKFWLNHCIEAFYDNARSFSHLNYNLDHSEEVLKNHLQEKFPSLLPLFGKEKINSYIQKWKKHYEF